VRLHLVPGLGRIKLVKLTPAHVQQFIREELAAGKGPRTVQLAHDTLRTALKQAELWGLVPRNVARLVTPPRYSPQERRPFTRDEQLRILAAARDDPLYVLFRLAHASGLRQSELLGLQWPDLDLDKGWLRVSKQLGRDGSLHRLKTKAARRAVPLPRVMVELLIRHRTEQEKMRADAVYWEDHDLVFTTRTGRPISHRNVHRSWTRILERAGVEHRGIHHLRHTWITTLAEQGVHERTAQKLAGHADGRMTREIYTHVTDTMLQEAADAIENIMGDDADDRANGSSSGSIERDNTEDDEGQEPEDGT
jgi:integrase